MCAPEAPRPADQAGTATDTRAHGVSLDSAIAVRLRDEAAPSPLGGDLWARVRGLYAAVPEAHWLGDAAGAARVRALLSALRRAHAHALRLTPKVIMILDAATREVARARAPGGDDTDARARADLLLTGVFAQYGQMMLTGQVSPRVAESAWHIDPRAVDVDSALARTLRDEDFARALDRLAPHEYGYATLRRGLAEYRAIASRGGWPAVRLTQLLHPGDVLPDAVPLRARLAAEGYLANARGAMFDSAHRYGGDVAAAVARFQARHGLAVDSIIGPRTLRALNVTAAERVRQIAVNLERYRWLPPTFGSRSIVVNVPAFRLDAFDHAGRVLTMRVVVGAELAGRHTPVFSDSMSYVQFGPYWNVPWSIARREILPKARRDREYLVRHDYELVRGWGSNASVVNPWSPSDAALMSGRYRVRQRPGPNNALGRVKFMFPNEYNVYLHDTPARELFARTVRAASHGCVRVADPEALAEFVLAGREDWPPARIRQTLGNGLHVRIPLAEKIPVYIVYLTAFDQNGAIAFRADRYQQDDALERALGAPPTPAEGAAALGALDEQLAQLRH